jgi:hypothetical protein
LPFSYASTRESGETVGTVILEPVTGGPSIEEYTPRLADKIADILGIDTPASSSAMLSA